MTDLIFALEIIGTIAFAVSGAMVGIEKKLDILGVIICGLFTAVGGGATRDIFMGNLPPVMFVKIEYVSTGLAASLAVFFLARVFKEKYLANRKLIDKINNIFDAVGLGVFTVGGMEVAILNGYGDNAFFIIFLGVITGCGGGIIRDVTVNEIPAVFRKNVYAVASLAGAVTYYSSYFLLEQGEVVAVFQGIAIVFIVRMMATTFKWHLPKAL
ncbi:MAG: trimeric intracellular cation channel family protein [Firmicutes bacterium]|nr:trimeric intracellular cation channel family protein [Bacillota bacterium]